MMCRRLAVVVLTSMVGYSQAWAGGNIDPDHVFAWFRVNHLGFADTFGRFNDISGTIDLDKGVVDIVIKSQSIDSQNEKRDQHLRGPDFFNAKQFPVLTFKAKSVKSLGDHTYQVSGDLMMRGVTKSLTLTVTKTGEGKDPWGKERIGCEAQFTIKRSDFGMDYMPDGIGDEVEIFLSAEAFKE